MVHDAIAKGGGGDEARFGIANGEAAIGAWLVGEAPQLLLQLENLSLQAAVEGEHIGPVAFAALGGFGGGQQAGEAGEARVEIMKEGLAHPAGAFGGWRRHQAGWRWFCCRSQPLSWRATASRRRLACS